jgi:hypothetical protein
MQPPITKKSKLRQRVKDRYIHNINDNTFDTYMMKPLLNMNLLTLIPLLIQYKHMPQTTTLHQIEAIIATEFECPRTDGIALMIRLRQFGIA